MTPNRELAEQLKIFKALDLDGDGIITKDELISGIKRDSLYGDIESWLREIIREK